MTRPMVVLVLLAAAVYAAMWAGYRQDWAWLNSIDTWTLGQFHTFGVAHPAWVTGWDVFCTALGPSAFRILGAGLILWYLYQRQYRITAFLFLTVEMSGPVLVLAKLLADRPRPETALAGASGTSFPSGHAVGVLVSVLALLTVALPQLPDRWRVPSAIAGAVLVCAIGIGRVVLNVHRPTDVIAGWALGCVIYLICVPVYRAAAGTRAAPGTAR